VSGLSPRLRVAGFGGPRGPVCEADGHGHASIMAAHDRADLYEEEFDDLASELNTRSTTAGPSSPKPEVIPCLRKNL
jgi:hypothetical protein